MLFPVGSTEAHGPHLPLFTDTILSDEVTLERELFWRKSTAFRWSLRPPCPSV